MTNRAPVAVALEVGRKRVFASALDWPGWCRPGRDRDTALAALGEYVGRYAQVVAGARLTLPDTGGAIGFDVVEELPGDATTDFGAPSIAAAAETGPCDARTARRVVQIMEACWSALDAVAATAPAALRKGPRGGGRDRDAIIEHVLNAERAYAGPKLGVRVPPLRPGDVEAIAAMRRGIVQVVAADRSGDRPADRGWPPRYAARRIAWHVLDHAWEIQDRSD